MEAERSQKMLAVINELGFANVDFLAHRFDVSSMTVRRDLKKLQENGMIIRCHGGAASKSEIFYVSKSMLNREAKVKIAAAAARHVKPGMTIYLDAGTTTYQLAKRIVSLDNLTVVTNDMEIALSLRNSSCELIICGGTIQKSTFSVFGSYASMMMKEFRFDAGFFGAARINSEFLVTTPTAEKGFLKKQVLSQCHESYLTVDSSKFGSECLHVVNSLSDYTAVITDRVFTARERQLIKEKGVNVIGVS